MSNALRNPWLAPFALQNLKDAIAERDKKNVAFSKAFDTLGPLGELQFPGKVLKPLQVIQFLSYEDPVTAVVSDKSFTITCKFSPESRSIYEASHERIENIKGALIKPSSYRIHFLGVDGQLFWKGTTYQDQKSDKLISSKKNHQLKLARPSSKSEIAPVPEPVLYIDAFTVIGSEGNPTWGSPTNISSKPEINSLLIALPRKKYSKEETPSGYNQNHRLIGSATQSPPQGKRKNEKQVQGSGNNTAHGTARGNTVPMPPKLPKGMHNLDDEVRSQSGIDCSVAEESQLAFATQAPRFFSSTYDDLDFSTQGDQEKKEEKKSTAPLVNPLLSSFQPTGHSPQVVIITKLQQKRKNSSPHHAKTSVGKEGKPDAKPKFINYSDGTGFDGSTAGSVISRGKSKIPESSSHRHKRKFGQRSLPESSSVGVEGKANGWQGMTKVEKRDTVIPKDQQELLDRPESWYPYLTGRATQSNHYTSGYSLIPKIQPTPKSYPPRDRAVPSPVRYIASVAPSQSPPSPSSDDGRFSWSSSPERDINAMPPDSSLPSGSQSHHAGRWSTQGNRPGMGSRSTQGTTTEDGSSSSYHESITLKDGFSRKQSSYIGSPPGVGKDSAKEASGDGTMGKRITRAANGISKRAPVDPNNVETSRMAKVNQRPRISVARKRARAESEQEEFSEASESQEDGLINDPDLPFEVVNPEGRTRVARFGGILKAQQVSLWEKKKKEARGSDNTEDETQNERDEVPSDYGSHESDEELVSSGELDGRIHDPKEGTVIVESESTSNEKRDPQDTSNHSHEPEPSGNGSMDIMEVQKPSPKVLTSRHLEAVEPLLLSESIISEPALDSSLDLPMGDIDSDGEDVIPLAIIASRKAKVSGILERHDPRLGQPKAMSVELDKKILGNNSQTDDNSSSRPTEARINHALSKGYCTTTLLPTPDILCSSTKTPTSSPTNTSPTVQVQETPYRRGSPKIKILSPTILKSRARPGYIDEYEDITLIPGTNTDELHNSGASLQLCATRQSISEQDSSPPEGQVISPHPTSFSTGIGGLDDSFSGDFHDDLSMSRLQLQHEMQQHKVIEVPATSEEGDTRIECVQSQPPLPSQTPSEMRKHMRHIKSVDFESQEIRAANAYSISGKGEFLGQEYGHDFEELDFQRHYSSPVSERQRSGAKACKGFSVGAIAIGLDHEAVVSVISQPNTRKRNQSPPPHGPQPVKKSRASDVSTHETGRSSPVLPSQNEPLSGLSRIESADDREIESEPLDLMAGFTAIDSLASDEPPWSLSNPTKPEMYAGIRERQIHVPGYGKLTEDEKKELDKRRREYFGITPSNGTNRLFSVELQRAMQTAWSQSPLKRAPKGQGVTKPLDEWYREENTPLKVFYRNFKELKQVKAELAIGNGAGERA